MTKLTSYWALAKTVALACIAILFSNCETSEMEAYPNEITSFIANDDSLSEGSMRTYASAQQCTTCDFMITSSLIDGEKENIRPGDILCLDASIQYDRLVFRNIRGTNTSPVVIRNCGGVAQIYSTEAFGIRFENCRDLKLTGDGSGDEYGIRVSTEKGFFINMEKFTTDFEIAHVEVAGPSANGFGSKAGFAGIGVKTSPYQDCELFTDPTRQAWIMRDVLIHDNYIHDTGGEGIYIGHGYYKGRKEAQCPSVTYSHSIKGVKIYNNRVEDVGYDGIQIKNANQKVEVYNNIIVNFGTKNTPAHNEGLFIGEGTTGKFYNNTIDSGTGNGCQVQGLGDIDFFNNVISNVGENGIYATHGEYVIREKDGYFNFFNNTIYHARLYGYTFYNDDGGPKRFINNLVVDAYGQCSTGAVVEETHNLFSRSTSSGFAGFLSGLFNLNQNSPGVNAGLNLRSYGIISDCEGTNRPKGSAYDIGAYENY